MQEFIINILRINIIAAFCILITAVTARFLGKICPVEMCHMAAFIHCTAVPYKSNRAYLTGADGSSASAAARHCLF